MANDDRQIEQLTAELGPHLRALRQERGLSLRRLATLAGISASLLSDVEHGHVNPSVASLFSLATALGVPAHTFFPSQPGKATPTPDAAPPPTAVIHPADRATLSLTGGITWQRLTPTPEGNIEFIEMRYAPGANSGAAMHHHPGRELGLVLEGQLLLELGFDRHFLGPGDSIAFDSTTPHRLSNPGTQPLRLAWVNLNQ
jgi:transcriptional regulator with XRE-family HTH domain